MNLIVVSNQHLQSLFNDVVVPVMYFRSILYSITVSLSELYLF